jgi:hypothetical protein
MYTGEVNLTEQSGKNILELLVSSDELLLEELFNHVQDYLFEKRLTWVEQNFVLVLHTVFKIPSCKKLQDYCLESICADPQPLLTSETFPSLDKDILYGLLKREDLHIEEIDAWNYLIKWGIEQTPGLGSKNQDRTKWNNTNYDALKKTLSEFIPLIRFSDINSKDFFDKVRPYKAVIPYRIYEEAMEFYMKDTLPKTNTLPSRIGKYHIDSKIIKPRLISVIINWIEKKDAKTIRNKKDSLYKFNLIHRGSQTGIDVNSFKNSCNSQAPVLVLVKCQNSQKIFGGYSDVGFYNNNNEGYFHSADSFIFSFETDNIQNMKLNRPTVHNNAMYNHANYGFCFGGGALYTQNQYLYKSSGNHLYDNNLNSNVDGYYTIEEIEAFKVAKQ